MIYVIGGIFLASMTCVFYMVSNVFPKLDLLVERGAMTRRLKFYIMGILACETALSCLVFTALWTDENFTILGQSYFLWLLAMQSMIMLNLSIWVMSFHKFGGGHDEK